MVEDTVEDVRSAAFKLLSRIDKERSYIDIILDRAIKGSTLNVKDCALLTELVYGVSRRQKTLDWLIGKFSNAPIERMQIGLVILLRLGIYQLLFLDRIPARAAVFETVALAKKLFPKVSGMVNAVLRRVDRERENLPYPSIEDGASLYLSIKHSHPEWIVKRWIEQLGFDESEKLAYSMSLPASLTLRVNSLKISRNELVEYLINEGGIGVEAAGYSRYAINVKKLPPLTSLDSFHRGFFTVQDESSQLALILLDPKPGENILDICAAPGGKASFAAELMNNRGNITAVDRLPRKLKLVSETAQRLGIDIIRTEAFDATKFAPSGGMLFDRILVDAPCSGLGVIRRNPEGKWWKSEEDIKRLSSMQRSILENASKLLREGGVMVYSTCSTTVDENEDVISDFLRKHPEYVLERVSVCNPELSLFATADGYFRIWTHLHGMDGFFAARLRKGG